MSEEDIEIGWSDFLGNPIQKNIKWLSFEEVRAFARSLNLKGTNEWFAYHKENKPEWIPATPQSVYKDKGWTNWGDFLGTGNMANKYKNFIPFEEARDFARSLNLKSGPEWSVYHKENKPEGFPFGPDRIYKDKGWISWGDFLGTGNLSTYEWLPFEEAREFARSLNLKSGKEWFAYQRENKPEGVPSAPSLVYKDKGWISWGDFLGTGKIANKYKNFISFDEARTFALSLNFKISEEWFAYHRENKPERVPYDPHQVYKDKGWTNWKDFLGN